MPTTVVNKRWQAYDVYIGRGSKWGNPFSHMAGTTALYKVDSRDEAVDAYRDYILHGSGQWLLMHLDELRGKRLGCFCAPHNCHGYVLAELADTLPDPID